jgi:hypothetical protein
LHARSDNLRARVRAGIGYEEIVGGQLVLACPPDRLRAALAGGAAAGGGEGGAASLVHLVNSHRNLIRLTVIINDGPLHPCRGRE